MGIHYDYKSTRGDKAMKKEAKRKARIEQRRAKRSSANPKEIFPFLTCLLTKGFIIPWDLALVFIHLSDRTGIIFFLL